MYAKFSKNAWNPEDFTQVSSFLTPGYVPFIQEEDCIVNDDRQFESGSKKYHYISLISKETFTGTVSLTTTCDFVEFGAPILVFSDDIVKDENGFPAYGHHFEIVAYEKGFNIWELNRKAKPIRVAFEEFDVPAKTPITLQAKISPEKDEIIVSLYGRTYTKCVKNMPKTFHAGITACEGVNHFYDFGAEE